MAIKTLHILYSGLGGTTNYVANWVKAAQGEMEIHCLFYGIENLKDETKTLFEDLGVQVFFVKKESRIDLKGHRKIKRLLSNGYDNILLHIDSLILPVAKHKPNSSKLIVIEHQANHLKDKRRWLWSKLAQKKADHIVSLTKEYQEELKKKLRNFKSSKNSVILTGIDIEKYSKASNDKGNTLFGAVGRLNSQRDFRTLIEAFNELGETYKLEIAGEGEDRAELQSLAKRNIKFLGELNDADMVKFLHRISAFLKPSFGETSSPAIMEAQAAGLPIIAWKVNGITNVLNTDNAILVDPNDVEGLKKSVIRLSGDNVESKNEIDRLSLASKNYATENLSHIKMYNAFKANLK